MNSIPVCIDMQSHGILVYAIDMFCYYEYG